MTSARALSSDWKIAKNPASQMISEIVESFIKRSMMEAMSRVAILLRELRRTGAAYWADASHMNMLRPAVSAKRFAMKIQRIWVVRG